SEGVDGPGGAVDGDRGQGGDGGLTHLPQAAAGGGVAVGGPAHQKLGGGLPAGLGQRLHRGQLPAFGTAAQASEDVFAAQAATGRHHAEGGDDALQAVVVVGSGEVVKEVRDDLLGEDAVDLAGVGEAFQGQDGGLGVLPVVHAEDVGD